MVQSPRVLKPEPAGPAGSGEQPLRIARVIARLNVGGPAQHVILLAAGLDPSRFRSTLITGVPDPDEGDLSPLARSQGITPVVIPSLGRAIRPGRDLAALGRLVALFRTLCPDLVHTHTAKAGALGRVAARLAGVPVVVHTFHGHILEGYFSPALTRLFLGIERALARRTDRIVTVSPRVRASLLARGIGRPEQVEVVPLGLPLQRFAAAAPGRACLRQRLAIPRDAPLLGIIGRLVPIKNHPALFAALTREETRGAHLLVVGDGERRTALEALARDLGLAGRVHFLGWRGDLEAILPELDVVICCSRNEGTPVALIEAMAAGVPVLSTDVGGVGDLLTHGQTGWLVPSEDPAALARGIRDLLADPAGRQRLVAAARPAALQAHSAEGLIQRIEAMYTALAAERLGWRRTADAGP
jgi:glycosyltransferase involved in cell wall biosynthesis